MRVRTFAAVPAVLAVFAVTGCSGFSLYPSEEPRVEEQAPTMGNVEPTGETKEDALGTYELVRIVNTDSLVDEDLTYRDPEIANVWSDEQVAAARAFALESTVSQFFDSEALDTGADAYAGWVRDEAGLWFNDYVAGFAALPENNAILTNAAVPQVPELMRDGKPRLKSLTWQDEGLEVGRSEAAGDYFDFSWNVEALYRVSDASAISFAAQVANYTEEEFLASAQPKPQLLDGEGENLYRVNTWLALAVQETEAGLRIVDTRSQTDFSTEDFINQE